MIRRSHDLFSFATLLSSATSCNEPHLSKGGVHLRPFARLTATRASNCQLNYFMPQCFYPPNHFLIYHDDIVLLDFCFVP